jgi:DNA-binding GntR family transcriptional regulator
VAAQFGVSQAVAREAFRALEARGLLVSLPRRGVRVPPLDRASVHELVVMRAALEPVALRAALALPARQWVDAAERAIDDAEHSTQVADWEAANQRFHLALVDGCGMPRMVRCIEDLHLASARYLHACWADLAWQVQSQDEHRQIVRLVRRKRHEEACTVLRDHILAAGTALEQVLP